MYLRIIGLLSFLIGAVITPPTVVSDIYKMSLYGEVEDTALAFCFNAASKAGFSYPATMAMLLWFAPVLLMIFGAFFFAGNHARMQD